MPFNYLLAAIAVVIIAALAFYAGVLLSKIKMQQEENKLKEEKQRTDLTLKKQQRNDNICENIRLIARATAQKQCNLSEAAIRLSVLLETLLIEETIDIGKQYPALTALFNKVKEMPTHEQRKKVPSKELKRLDKQRTIYETQFEQAILKEAALLANFSL